MVMPSPARYLASQRIAVHTCVGHSGGIPINNPGFIFDDGIAPVSASLLANMAIR
jgi:hypothetical protein